MPCSLHRPRSAFERRLPEDLPAVLLFAFLTDPLGSEAMRDVRFTSAHHRQLGKEDRLFFSVEQRVKFSIIKLRAEFLRSKMK